MNAPRPTAQTPALPTGDDTRVVSLSKPAPKTAANVARDGAVASPAASERDALAVTALADITDRSLHAAVARFTGGLSPAALAHA
jgi:hypothetical protein